MSECPQNDTQPRLGFWLSRRGPQVCLASFEASHVIQKQNTRIAGEDPGLVVADTTPS